MTVDPQRSDGRNYFNHARRPRSQTRRYLPAPLFSSGWYFLITQRSHSLLDKCPQYGLQNHLSPAHYLPSGDRPAEFVATVRSWSLHL